MLEVTERNIKLKNFVFFLEHSKDIKLNVRMMICKQKSISKIENTNKNLKIK